MQNIFFIKKIACSKGISAAGLQGDIFRAHGRWNTLGRVFGTLCLFFIIVSAAGAEPVKINGKKLDDVQDILTETMGRRNFLKHDLIHALWYKPNSSNDTGSDVRLYPMRFDPAAGSHTEKPPVTLYGSPPKDNEWTSGMHPAITTRPVDTNNGYRVLLPDFSHHGNTTLYHTGVVRMDENGDFKIDGVRELQTNVPAGNVYPTGTTAGLFVDGEEAESFVAARMTVAEGGKTHLGDKVTTYNFYLEFLDGRKLNDGANNSPTALSLPLGSATALCPSVRVAAGDFDNDGKASEVACIFSGPGRGYMFQIYKITRDANGSFSASKLYEHDCGRRDNSGKNIDGCDVAAGDFNGDGKQEVAAVFNDLNDDGSGYATVQIFYHSGDGFQTEYNSVRDKDHRLGGTSISVYHKFYGLLAAAGDLDGDGKDEIIYAAPLYGNMSSANQGNVFLSVWSAGDNFSPSERYLMRTGNYLQQHGAMPYYTLQFLSLAAAPLSGNLNASGMACSDVLLSLALREADLKSDDGNILWLYKSRLSGTSFSGFQDGVKILREDKGFAAAPMTANFAKESLLLGEPTHMVIRSRKSYASVMQAPPYHVDYITAPWSESGSPALTNFSYTGSSVTYEKNNTESQTKDIAFDARQFTERGVDVGGSATATVKKLAGFSVGGSASLGWKKSTSQSLSAANNSSASTAATITSKTNTSDSLMFYKADFHIWRYPVIAPAPTGLFGAAINGTISGTEDGTQYFTYTMSDEPTRVQGDAGQSSQFDDYNPIHEEGNLFSYPTTIEGTPGYADKQVDLSLALEKTLGGDYTEELTFSQQVTDITSLKTIAKDQRNGSLSLSLGWPKIVAGSLSVNSMKGQEIGDSSSFTKSYQSSEGFKADFASPKLGFNADYVSYLMKMRAYADAAGVMNMAFAVDLADDPTAWLWRTTGNGSVYTQKPDPSLILPTRYSRYKDSEDLIKWTVNLDERSATQIRGIRFYDNDNLAETTSSLRHGGNYTISIPIYNASFVDAGNVTVEMGYADESGAKQSISRRTAALKGWKENTEDNKAVVSFDWTVPAGMAEGNYDFYFQIDPDNEIDEIHKNWNATSGDANYDPGGNNKGRYPFAVTSGEANSNAAADAIAAEAFSIMVDGMSFTEFRDSLADKTEDFRAYGTVAFSGDRPLHNVYVELTARDIKGGAQHERLVANRYIPAVFPGAARDFSFLVSPSELKGLRLTVAIRCDEGYISFEKKPSGGGSGGGCNTGWGAAALLLALALLFRPRRRTD